MNKTLGLPNKVRPQDEIAAEYSALCTALGDRQFKLKLLNDEIEVIVQKLDALNRESIVLGLISSAGKRAE